MQLKRYSLTRLGDQKNRRVFFRRDANCPVITHARCRDVEHRSMVPAWLVNLSEDGALLTSDHFPARLADVYIIIPGLGAKVLATVRDQGEFTINVQFETQLTQDVVDMIARLTVIPKELDL